MQVPRGGCEDLSQPLRPPSSWLNAQTTSGELLQSPWVDPTMYDKTSQILTSPSPGSQHKRSDEAGSSDDVELGGDHRREEKPSAVSPWGGLSVLSPRNGVLHSGPPPVPVEEEGTTGGGASGLVTASGSQFRLLHKLLLLAIFFLASLSLVVALLMTLPELKTLEEHQLGKDGTANSVRAPVFKLPGSMEEVRQLRAAMEGYRRECAAQLAVAFCALFLFLQTFMVPGSLFLSILAGSLFGFYHGLLLVSVVSAVGASCCYALSHAILREIVVFYFAQRCEWMSREVQRQRHSLLNYILCLRIVPVVPAWFVNLAAPIVAVPFREFFIGTFLGFIPSSVVSVKAGCILSEVNSARDLYDLQTVLALAGMAALSLAPVFLKNVQICQGNKRP